MINFLQYFEPNPVLLEQGLVKIYWYGLIIVLAVVVASWLFYKLANKNQIQKNITWDLIFYLIVFGLIGARIWHVIFYNLEYFITEPIKILYVWHGGMAIFGSITAGIITLWYWARKYKINFLLLADLVALVLPLGQAIGRWGNYFNQELFGPPCNYWWCIRISQINRPVEYLTNSNFHPVFLYESILLILLFVINLAWYYQSRPSLGKITLSYLGGYAFIRLLMEFLRFDITNRYFGLNWLQWLCFGIIISSLCILLYKKQQT